MTQTLRPISVVARRVARGAAVVACAVAALVGTGANAQVLPLLPSESLVVIKVNNLQAVSDKAAGLIKDWGLDQMRPELTDPLGSVLTMTGMGAGLDKAGEVGVAIMPPNQAAAGGRQGPPDFLALVPVTDYKAFIGALPKATTEGELTTIKAGGRPVFVTNWGKYAAVSPNQALATTKGQGIVPPPASAKELATKDVVVFANFKEIRKIALPQFQMMKPFILAQMNQGMQQAPNANPQMTAMVSAYMGQILSGVETFMTDADGVTFGITLDKDGISTTLLTDFSPGSYLGKAVAGAKNTGDSLTGGLPAGKYMIYGGMVFSPNSAAMFNDFLGPIEKAVAGAGDAGKPAAAYFAATRDFMGAVRQMNFGLMAPPANALQGGGFVQGVSVMTGDADKLAAAMKTISDNSTAMMAASGMGNIKTVVTPGAQVGAATLDKYATTYGEPQNAQEQQMSVFMEMIYGKGGPSGYVGKVAADKMIQTIGGGEALAASAVQAVGQNADPIAQGAAANVLAKLPKERVAVMFVAVDQIATTVLDVMAAKGVPGGVKLPPNLPPVGAA
ncbi:MAG TPA: hypothetical protein VEA69_23110, partial [Tepidisphaeraceae bacterium]|nr:hypothetical protein [Tepidisphaeraceae bacterium]